MSQNIRMNLPMLKKNSKVANIINNKTNKTIEPVNNSESQILASVHVNGRWKLSGNVLRTTRSSEEAPKFEYDPYSTDLIIKQDPTNPRYLLTYVPPSQPTDMINEQSPGILSIVNDKIQMIITDYDDNGVITLYETKRANASYFGLGKIQEFNGTYAESGFSPTNYMQTPSVFAVSLTKLSDSIDVLQSDYTTDSKSRSTSIVDHIKGNGYLDARKGCCSRKRSLVIPPLDGNQTYHNINTIYQKILADPRKWKDDVFGGLVGMGSQKNSDSTIEPNYVMEMITPYLNKDKDGNIIIVGYAAGYVIYFLKKGINTGQVTSTRTYFANSEQFDTERDYSKDKYEKKPETKVAGTISIEYEFQGKLSNSRFALGEVISNVTDVTGWFAEPENKPSYCTTQCNADGSRIVSYHNVDSRCRCG